MKKVVLTILVFAIAVLVLIFTGGRFSQQTSQQPPQLLPIRVGWQVPWATQGQLSQILQRTSLLADQGLHGDFIGFNYGGPLNEAALAGEVDVLFTADQPAATLLSRDPHWVIIGRLMYNRVSLYVPPNSPIQTVEDLRGKTVAMPFGAAAQRMALRAEQDAGLDVERDVRNVNLDIYEQSDLVRDPEALRWGEIDALAGFDPTPAIFEEQGLIRTLSVGKVVSVIVMSTDYIEAHPDAPAAFLNAFRGAYDFYRNNTSTADQWFTEASKLDIPEQALHIAASIEPNLSAESDGNVRLSFTDEDFATLQEAADFLYDQSLIAQPVTMKDHIDLTYLQMAFLY